MLPIRDDGPVGVWLDKWKRRQRQKAARHIRETVVLTAVLSVVLPLLLLAVCEYFGVRL